MCEDSKIATYRNGDGQEVIVRQADEEMAGSKVKTEEEHGAI